MSLRGAVCILVVLYHVDNGFAPQEGADAALQVLSFFNAALETIRIPTFAFLAGIAYASNTEEKREARSFWKRRVRQLALPLLAATLVFWIIANVLFPDRGYVGSDVGFIAALFGPFIHLWFLNSLLWCIAALWTADRFGLLSNRVNQFVFLIISFLGILLFKAEIPEAAGFRFAFTILPFVTAGMVFVRAGLLRDEGNKVLWVAMLALSVVASGCFSLLDWQSDPVLGLAAVFPAVLFASSWLKVGLVSRTLATLGRYSYAIYLYHVLGTSATRQILLAVGVDSSVLHILSGLAFGVLLPIMLVRLTLVFDNFAGVPFATLFFGRETQQPKRGVAPWRPAAIREGRSNS
jgi:peptidoglycan/LPS O-acetylase OafA/YrhL